MRQDVRFIVLNRDEGYAAQLRALLRQTDGVKIVAEVDEPALLAQAIRQFRVDAVLVNLDPNPDAILPAVGEVTVADPGLPVFAVSESTDGPLILKTMRLGAREFFPKPIDTKTLSESVAKVATQRPTAGQTGTLITVLGAAGGVGATMLTTNLATELAMLAKGSVTIVDLDYRFGQVATLLDVEPRYTLADLCNSPEELETQVIERTLVKHESGLHVLSRPPSLAEADSITAASCVGVLSGLMQFNEYVLTDGPNRADQNTTSVLDLSDSTLLLVQLLVPTVRNAARIIEAMREGGHNLEHTKLICNRTGHDAASLSVKDVSETLALPVFASIPDDWSTVSGAINLGETLAKHSPKSKVRQAIREIAERLHTPECKADERDTQRKGLIGRIFASS